MKAHKVSRLAGRVRADAAGLATLRARAVSTAAADVGGGTGADNVYLSVRRPPEQSVFGHVEGVRNDAVTTGCG